MIRTCMPRPPMARRKPHAACSDHVAIEMALCRRSHKRNRAGAVARAKRLPKVRHAPSKHDARTGIANAVLHRIPTRREPRFSFARRRLCGWRPSAFTTLKTKLTGVTTRRDRRRRAARKAPSDPVRARNSCEYLVHRAGRRLESDEQRARCREEVSDASVGGSSGRRVRSTALASASCAGLRHDGLDGQDALHVDTGVRRSAELGDALRATAPGGAC